MHINRLREFIVLATLCNYSKAANQLYMTQPALSRHIRDLEESLGASLFVRDTHKVSLTPIGQLFFEEAKIVVEHYDSALKKVQEALEATSDSVRFGFLGSAVKPFLNNFYTLFKEKYPHIDVDFIADDMPQLMQMLDSNEIDCALCTHFSTVKLTGLCAETLIWDQLGLVVNNQHPLSKKKTISLEDLDDLPLVSYSAEASPYVLEHTMEIFKEKGLKFHVSQYTHNLETALFLVDIGMGGFLLPTHLSDHVANNLNFVPIEDEAFDVDLTLVYKKNNPNNSTEVFFKAFTNFIETGKI